MSKFEMISLYTAGRKMKVSDSTNQLQDDLITRIFEQLSRDFGVEMKEEEITGLTSTKLQKWFNAASEGRKPATVNAYVCALNPFLRWANEMGYTTRDLSKILHTVRIPDIDTLPEDERPKDKYLSHEEAEALINTTSGRNRVRDRAIIALILYSGLRVSELCSLTIGQMEDRTKPITVKRKGGRYTPVVISENFWPYLDAYLATRKDKDNPKAPLFMTSHGQPCSRIQLYKAISHKQEAMGLATGPHALRHTFVSEVENTCGAGVARDCANHKSLAITNRYDHTTHDQRQAAVNSLRW